MADRAGRSLRASSDGVKRAKEKLNLLAQNKNVLADKLEISRSLIQKFFAGKPVGYENFRKICDELNLPWKEIAGLPIAEITGGKSDNSTSNSQDCPSNPDLGFVGRESEIASKNPTAEKRVVSNSLPEQSDCKETYPCGVFIPNARCRCVWGRDDLIEEVLQRLTNPHELPILSLSGSAGYGK